MGLALDTLDHTTLSRQSGTVDVPGPLKAQDGPIHLVIDSTGLKMMGDGEWLVLTLRKPYANGTTDFIFSEVELAQKLAVLVPPIRKNGVTYHGVLAPRHRLRKQGIPEPPATEPRERLCKTPESVAIGV
jgi:hypothetical protein